MKPNLLIIGSTGRNTGKTEFACSVIKKHSGQEEIIGIKIIPVDKNEGVCHRPESGCGLCDSLTGDYDIIEEKTTGSMKDTSRMLKSGAKKTYLLLVDRNSLEKGIGAILETIPDHALVIIESNTIRKVIEPGLFIIIKRSKEGSVKQTCTDVMEFADKIVEFNDMKWDFHPDKVLIKNKSWIIEE